MNAVKLTLVLALVAGIASAALALTYGYTKPAIEKQEEKQREAALGAIFFDCYENARIEAKTVETGGGTSEYFRVWRDKNATGAPAYYAVGGRGIGYNAGVPIELLVGFTNPDRPDVPLPGGKKAQQPGFVCVGWQVIKSEETPGLGEVIKDKKPPWSWSEKLTGNVPPADPDTRTPKQKQFAGLLPQDMKAKETIDVFTSATYTTKGVIAAIRDAEKNLERALKAQP